MEKKDLRVELVKKVVAFLDQPINLLVFGVFLGKMKKLFNNSVGIYVFQMLLKLI